MCGIVGFIKCGTEQELVNSVRVIDHRGPDAQSVKWFPNAGSGLGHARLSIIDLSDNGKQPMYDPRTGNWIVFNGEVYNYKQIRLDLQKEGVQFFTESDTEVVLKAFGQWGEEAVQHMNGMFAFAVYNEGTKALYAIRDRLGIKPFYYYHSGNKLVFASELKSILQCSDYVKEPDYEALHTPAHYQVTPNTGFKNILKLPAGNQLNFVDGKLSINEYWTLTPHESPMPYQEAFDELDRLLNDAIDLQMIADVPIGSLLSGGLDSSLISVMMQRKIKEPINTYTIKFSETDLKRQGNVDDSSYAMELAKKFKFNHKEILIRPNIVDLLPKMVNHLEEPIADPAAINTYLISAEARKAGVKVLLSGMGADEVFSGYRSHLACLKATSYQRIPKHLRLLIEPLIDYMPGSGFGRDFKYARWLKSFVRIASLPQRERAMLVKNSALSKDQFEAYFMNPPAYDDTLFLRADKKHFEAHPQLSYLTKMCYVDTKIYMPDHNLAYSDKAMMAASVEGRPPLIDHRIVELMFSLPPEFRISGNTQKYLLKKVAEKYIPHNIIYRPKAPFSAPMRGWLRGELKEMVNDILSFDSISSRGVYNPTFVRQLIEDNNLGRQDNSQLIWRLMVNEIWFRNFFD
ncbi:asparagine synthase (glutamine-hydrolyzing) [Bacteroidota bacterium]